MCVCVCVCVRLKIMPYALVIRDLCNFSNVPILTFVSFVTKVKSWPRFKISICCDAFRPFSDVFRQVNYVYNYKKTLRVVS